MLRSDLIKSVLGVKKLIENSKVDEVLELLFISGDEARKQVSVGVISAMADLNAAKPFFSVHDIKVIELLGLSDLFSNEWWSYVLSLSREEIRNAAKGDKFHKVRSNIRSTKNAIPKILGLLAREGGIDEKYEEQIVFGKERSEYIFIILPENDVEHSTPARIAEAMSAVAGLYACVAKIRGLSESGLSVVACDSGSNKLFSFKGVEGIIRELRTLILDL